jgi:DNA-binding NarL/FixJ family response regulator
VDLNDLPALLRQAISGIEVRPPTNRSAGSQASLTNREREVLRLASQGMSNTDIAHDLFVTEQTVKFHLSNVYRKMGVHNRTEASHRAARAGILG